MVHHLCYAVIYHKYSTESQYNVNKSAGLTPKGQSVVINRNPHLRGDPLTLYNKGHTSELSIKDMVFILLSLFVNWHNGYQK